MIRSFVAALLPLTLSISLLLSARMEARASDHADPIFNRRLEAGLTDLFAFPSQDGVRKREGGESLVLILCARRSLAKKPPFQGLDQLEFKIHLDFHTSVRTDSPSKEDQRVDQDSRDQAANLLRYGGTVEKPEEIKEDLTITLRFNDDTTLKTKTIEGKGFPEKPRELNQIEGTRIISGVYDDPFIFPQFFKANTIAAVISIPFARLPQSRTFLIWATSSRNGEQVDHVGRSQRTQLPRFDFLNTVHPSKQVAALKQRQADPDLITDFLQTQLPPAFRIRPYDLHPDVMIYQRDKPIEFPNGRFLEDDVAEITHRAGDCQLWELSFSHPRSAAFVGGRPTKNDKPFVDYPPYLAAPHDDPVEPAPPALTMKNSILVVMLVLIAAFAILLPWTLYFYTLRKLRMAIKRGAAI